MPVLLSHSPFECNKQLVVMHVCWLNPMSQSGYEVRVVEEARILHGLGIRVIIACFIASCNPFSPDQIIGFYRRLKDSTGAKIYILPARHFFDMDNSTGMFKEVTSPIIAIARLHNVSIIHGQALYSTKHILRAKPHLAAKVVFDVHGISPEEMEMAGESALRVECLEKWEEEALKAADLRIFVSTRMKSYLEHKYGFANHPSVLLPCCVHVEKFGISEGERLEKRTQMGFTDKFVFLYLGTLSVWQWPEALFSLFSQVYREKRECLFYLLLPRGDHSRAEELCRKYQLPPGSYLIEEKPHDEVGSFIGVADAGFLLRKAHPVNYVSSPTKFGEYLAAGVPVIGTREIGDASKIIEKKNVGLLISANDGGVTSATEKDLLCFVDDVKWHRQQWSRRCRKASAELMDWNQKGVSLSEGYKSILTGEGERSTDC